MHGTRLWQLIGIEEMKGLTLANWWRKKLLPEVIFVHIDEKWQNVDRTKNSIR